MAAVDVSKLVVCSLRGSPPLDLCHACMLSHGHVSSLQTSLASLLLRPKLRIIQRRGLHDMSHLMATAPLILCVTWAMPYPVGLQECATICIWCTHLLYCFCSICSSSELTFLIFCFSTNSTLFFPDMDSLYALVADHFISINCFPTNRHQLLAGCSDPCRRGNRCTNSWYLR
jgi:hypothetical protein